MEATVPSDAPAHRAVLPPAARCGPLRVRRRRALRPAVPADAVPRHLPADVRPASSFPWELPLEYRYEGNIFSGEKRMELHRRAGHGAPHHAGHRDCADSAGAAANGEPRSEPGSREVHVSVTNHAKGAATGEARLDLPAGWTASPATIPVTFSREDEAITVRFRMRPQTQPGLENSGSPRRCAPGDRLRPRLPGHRVSAHAAAATSSRPHTRT